MADMELVNSSRITEYGYAADTATVYVTFTDGVRWQYQSVPEHVWEQFRLAASKGRFIRDVLNGYPNGPA